MILKLIPWVFLFLVLVYIFYITYKYFRRNPPKENSVEYFKNIDHDDENSFI